MNNETSKIYAAINCADMQDTHIAGVAEATCAEHAMIQIDLDENGAEIRQANEVLSFADATHHLFAVPNSYTVNDKKSEAEVRNLIRTGKHVGYYKMTRFTFTITDIRLVKA